MKKLYLFLFSVFASFSFAQDYNVSSIPEHLVKNAHAVIRDWSEDYSLKSVSDMTVKRTYVSTIMNAAGEDYSRIYIPYNPTTRVSGIKVEMFDASGKIIKTFSKKDFADYTNNPSAGLYVDDRILVLQPVTTQYPFTLKLSYETSTSNTINLRSFSPISTYNVSLEKSSFVITNNSGIPIRTKINDKPIGKVSEIKEGNIWRYSYQNIPAIKQEDLAPSLEYLLPDVQNHEVGS